MLTITIEYKPIPPRRKGTTHAITAAIRTLMTTPNDAAGNPASFNVPVKHYAACRIAAKDAGAKILCRTEQDGVLRVILQPSETETLPIPLQ